MEKSYNRYKGFWYKLYEDDGMTYYKISREKDDSKCDVWCFNTKYWKLGKAIEKIKQTDNYENL